MRHLQQYTSLRQHWVLGARHSARCWEDEGISSRGPRLPESPGATTPKTRTVITEARIPQSCALQQEKPAPYNSQPEEASADQQRPSAARKWKGAGSVLPRMVMPCHPTKLCSERPQQPCSVACSPPTGCTRRERRPSSLHTRVKGARVD